MSTQPKSFEELQRRHVAEARTELDASVARLDWSRDRLLQYQADLFRDMLTYAKEHSTYYRRILKNVDSTEVRDHDSLQQVLARIPVLNKQLVMQHFDEISTDPELTLQRAQEHLAAVSSGEQPNPYLLGKYFIFATGGTSGTRGTFVWDWDLVKDSCCVVERSTRWLEQRGLLPMAAPHKRTAILAAGSLAHASGTVHPMIPLLDPGRNVKRISLDLPFDEMLRQLNEYQPDRMFVYASLIEQLAQAQQSGQLQLKHLEWILAVAEPLEQSARQASLDAFGINVHDGYGTTEAAAISIQSSPDFHGMIVAEDSVLLELVDEEGHPMTGDEGSSRLVISRLHGKSFPLIRYEMNDTVVVEQVFSNDPNKQAPRFSRILSIEGRSDVWFEYKESSDSSDDARIKVAPILFRSVLLRFDAILEYQVQQIDSGAHILLICSDRSFTATELEQTLCDKLVHAGLERPVVTTKVVDNLPRHPETNKLRRFVPLEKTKK